jgi:hypothetical protein
MKPQDIVFILIVLLLLWKRNPKYFILTGLAGLVLAIPLFQFWIFFTAERLVMYAVGFLFVGIILMILKD